jgi:uncharacterized protein
MHFTDSILNDLENFEDGNFQIRNHNGFAMLTVYKAGKSGKPVHAQDVYNRLKLFGIEKYDKQQIEMIVKSSEGIEYKIAEWAGGNPQDASIDIEISEDKMQAFLTLNPPKNGGNMISKTDVILLIKNSGIRFGLKEELVSEIILKTKYYIKFLIAEGIPPLSATNGYINILFDSGNKPSLNPDERGKVNFKDINIIKSVNSGDTIAEKIDPRPGQIGKNIFGQDIPFDIGEQGEWKIGENCSLDDSGKLLRANISGRPILDRDGTIRVDEVCYLENVDYSTGNVDFPGTIIVEGNVADNFTLRTKGSLIIKKSVGRVFLYADKDIVLSGGVMGRNGGYIEAGNDIYAKFIEQGNVKAGRSILIEEAAMHSEMVCGESVIILGGRGELIGGETIAGSFISVSKLGAVVETRTNIVVGLPPMILEELKKMKTEIFSKEETLSKIIQSVQKTNETMLTKKEISNEEKELFKKLIGLEKKYLELISNLKKQYEVLLSNYDASDVSYIEVDKFIYPRVSVNFGKGKLYNSELKTINGKCYIYINSEGYPTDSVLPPKSIKKLPQSIQKPIVNT